MKMVPPFQGGLRASLLCPPWTLFDSPTLVCLALLLLSLGSVGCTPSAGLEAGADLPQPNSTVARREVLQQPIELALLMGELQRHSQKLGYSIRGHNRPLASLYLQELAEVLELVEQIEELDGMPIAHPASVILTPTLDLLEPQIESESWPEARQSYELLIDACNRCHAATEHEAIQILPIGDERPPFNQRFDAPDTANTAPQ